MKEIHQAKDVGDGRIDPKHEIEKVCADCGYDLDSTELNAGSCSDCGAPLSLRQNTKIFITTLPSAEGDTLL